jgi:hypothetical protein
LSFGDSDQFSTPASTLCQYNSDFNEPDSKNQCNYRGVVSSLGKSLCSEKRIQINFPSIARTNGVARAPAVVRQFDALQSQQLTKYTMHKAGGECDCCASNRR